MGPSPTHYARSGEASIAYRTLGEGGRDVVFLPGWISHVEHVWELPSLRRFLERLAALGRLIIFDRRGTGLSERVSEAPDLATDVRDAIAVLDAVGSERTVAISYAVGGPVALSLAAEHPERVSALVAYASGARTAWAEDYPWAMRSVERRQRVERLASSWGEGRQLELLAPSVRGDAGYLEWFARLERLASSPGVARAMSLAAGELDVRGLLGDIAVPTLVLHRSGDGLWDIRHSRFLAEHIPGARYVELPGEDSVPWEGDADGLLAEIEEFLTGRRGRTDAPRALLSVMFTDVVGATSRAAAVGDRRWRDLLAAHDEVVRRELARYDGEEIKTIGDSFLATFSGPPSRALRCAAAIAEAVGRQGLALRAGVHTGECELLEGDVAGMAVHIAARVAALAGPGEVLASGTAYGTVVGSGLLFQSLGEHELRGVEGRWPIFRLL